MIDTDGSARANWISSFDILPKESVLTFQEEFNDRCVSTWRGYEARRFAFNSSSACS
jgi:hypothetical protein